MIEVVRELGGQSLSLVEGLGRATSFGGALVASLPRTPTRFGFFLRALYDVGVLSVALIALSAYTVGMVLGLQLYTTLTRFGAEEGLGAVVGLTLTRELGPVLTGLLVTGRAGSAITAEIGAMKSTEQLDGLRMMAIDPVHFVAMPRALALTLSVPLLSGIFIVVAIAGAYTVGVSLQGLDGGVFLSGLEESVLFREDVGQSLVKSLVFGMLLGLISTYKGHSCEPNAEGVARATTSTVVTTSVCILLSDYVLTAFWDV
ncbi:MAG: ABC transporter permease [Deltaproteobacteria bacterium]|jgi:phospholipid/cholesterol/gamma-HCH transport system permease protein|nr:ABC transporter permease [Deltaproteobacteria bacterium]MBW2495806.1 ABC transporter permease [Deltaproteobacteria bacterium]